METICDKLCNPMQVSLPHKLHHCACLLSEQSRMLLRQPYHEVLQRLTLEHEVIFITWLACVTEWAQLYDLGTPHHEADDDSPS